MEKKTQNDFIEDENKDDDNIVPPGGKFNWRLLAVIIMVLVAAIVVIDGYGVFETRKEVYLRFENKLDNASVPRYQCVKVKIMSKDVDIYNVRELFSKGSTSISLYESYVDIPDCEAENAHFTNFPLTVFCEDPNCKIDGVVCATYHIDYLTEDTNKINAFESAMFTNKNVTYYEADKLMMECDVDGRLFSR